MEAGLEEIEVGRTLIAANFNIRVDKMKLTEFAQWNARALWLEKWRLSNLAEMQKAIMEATAAELQNIQ